jgi:hypothetical protein
MTQAWRSRPQSRSNREPTKLRKVPSTPKFSKWSTPSALHASASTRSVHRCNDPSSTLLPHLRVLAPKYAFGLEHRSCNCVTAAKGDHVARGYGRSYKETGGLSYLLLWTDRINAECWGTLRESQNATFSTKRLANDEIPCT